MRSRTQTLSKRLIQTSLKETPRLNGSTRRTRSTTGFSSVARFPLLRERTYHFLSCQVFAFEGEEGIFAGGGKGRGNDVWNSVEFYSVAGDAWRAIGALNRARNSFAMSLVGKQVGGKYFISCFFLTLVCPTGGCVRRGGGRRQPDVQRGGGQRN